MATPLEPSRPDQAPQGGSNRALGFVFMWVFVLVGLWSVWKQETPWIWAFATGAAFGIVALVAPGILGPFNRVWTALGQTLHKLMSPLILALLFYGLFTPMALFMAAIGKRPLQSRKHDVDSYWIDRAPPGPEPETLRNPY